MPGSLAYNSFLESIQLAELLMAVERDTLRYPPRQEEQPKARALRGGAAVLMVASFEHFLRECFEHHLSALVAHPVRVEFSRLPERIRITSIYGTLDRAMKGAPYSPSLPKGQRLSDIDQAARDVISGRINPSAFADTGGNPSSSRVKEMFKSVDIADIFSQVKTEFDRSWSSPTAHTYIADKLDEIVGRRHVVAHTADALNISRSDLQESVRFLKVLALILDIELERTIDRLV